MWELPWQGKRVPHAVLDIMRGCNISCRACYNSQPSSPPKPLEEIESELDQLLRFRHLSSVSIVGGEVTLHPQLCEIIQLVRSKDLEVELVTNGLLIDQEYLNNLASAGLTIIYFHVEKGQDRPDLPVNHSYEQINELRRQKALMSAEAGIEVGLTLTVYPEEKEELHNTLDLMFRSPQINYLLVTLYRDISLINILKGNIFSGMSGEGSPPRYPSQMHIKDIVSSLKNDLHMEPFGFVGSNVDRTDPRWLSYLVAVNTQSSGAYNYQSLQASPLEKSMMFLLRLFRIRYPMFIEQNAERFRKHLFLNGMLTGRYLQHQALIKESKLADRTLRAKRILFQNPAELREDGTLIHCQCCPDAIIKNGSLVPVCIADKVV
ncbi:MAG: radical SAM protein [Desulfobulbaceae bacterium]|nr:radical SAM protein [Desulfobulbaceae bacterium]